MDITELVEQSGVASATIKYYVRTGLLWPGERLSGKHTEYSEAHLDRLRLVRAMLEVGKLSIASVRDVLIALDTPALGISYAFEIAQRALSRPLVLGPEEPSADAVARVDALVQRAGWNDCSDNVGIGIVARVLDGADAAGLVMDDSFLDGYAAAATTIAEADIAALRGVADSNATAQVMVVGTVLGDPLSAGLRRIAQAYLVNQPDPDHLTHPRHEPNRKRNTP